MNNIDKKRIPPLFSLAFPVIIENLLRVALSSTDVLMLGSYSQAAVAAIGFVSQFAFFLMMLHNVIGIGTSILIAQYVGAGQTENAKMISRAGTLLMLIFGGALTILFTAGTFPLLSLYNLEGEVRRYALQYLLIFNLFSLFSAFAVLFGAILRSYGHAGTVMLISILSGFINVAGNAVSLYGPFGCPVLGVPGVAFSTVFSQICCCVLLWRAIRRNSDVSYSTAHLFNISSYFQRKILGIGIPTVGESIAWSGSQIVIISIITTLGTSSMSAFTYLNTILRLVFTISTSLGAAVQIKIGMFCGAGRKEKAYSKLFIYQIIGTAISVSLIFLLFFFRKSVVPFFTKDIEILAIIYSLLPVCIIQEVGRSINLVTIPALKGAGDIKFPVFIGICSMWIVAVGGGMLLSVGLKMKLYGILCMMAADECIRAVLVSWRWRTKRWQKKILIDN